MKKHLPKVLWFIAAVIIICIINNCITQSNNPEEPGKKVTEKNDSSASIKKQMPDVDTINLVVNRIIYTNHAGEDSYLLDKLIKDVLGDNFNDTTKVGSTILISFDLDQRLNKDSCAYKSRSLNTFAEARLDKNFDPYNKKYKYQTPIEGYTLKIFFGFSNLNEQEIADLVRTIMNRFSPAVYKRKDFFESKEEENPRLGRRKCDRSV